MARDRDNERRTGNKTRAAFFVSISAIVAATALSCALVGYSAWMASVPEATPIPGAERAEAVAKYIEAHDGALHPYSGARELSTLSIPARLLPPGEDYSATELSRAVRARAAILVDAATGKILFERDADELIPPASMTKLVAMYVALKAQADGKISFDDVVALPSESWAENIPPGSSLMFLARGQTVTVRELLAGMAVVSGNDAAIALAYHVAGSVPAFVDMMNAETARLGLRYTRFVEPSGLSELNVTTPREFADFALVYCREFPEALAAFHSRERLEYPMPWNLPAGRSERPIAQESTNRLLGKMDGCDGLKTGFIRESGFNLTATARRNGVRFISVTMGGPGSSMYEGTDIRSRDGQAMLEWAFAHYATDESTRLLPVEVAVWKGRENALEAIPAGDSAITVPRSALGKIRVAYDVPRSIRSPVLAGDQLGKIDYYYDGELLRSVPLVADRTIHTASFPKRALDHLAMRISPIFELKNALKAD
ncbi:MAG TPA: D-alanyl-D-alanine carboxypeptidase family protein [Treponemataceae bacterium]|nr:D-alanyl-D-alanine carboxypeptidase family protein [Treponemataceae bacterium]